MSALGRPDRSSIDVIDAARGVPMTEVGSVLAVPMPTAGALAPIEEPSEEHSRRWRRLSTARLFDRPGRPARSVHR